MPALPLDVSDLIIEILAEDLSDVPSVFSCSLVCHAFLHMCRRHIFGSVALRCSSEERTSTLNGLLSTTPVLSSYIRYLSIEGPLIISQNIIPDSTLSDTIKKFTHLRSIRLLNVCFGDGSPHDLWSSEQSGDLMRPGLLHLFHLPSLRGLRLQNCRDFSLADLVGSNIKHLDFEYLKVLQVPAAKLPDSSIKLQALVIGGRDNYIKDPEVYEEKCSDGKYFFDVSELKLIVLPYIGNQADDVVVLRGLFSRCHHLEQVELSVTNDTFSLFSPAKILVENSSIWTLKTLCIDVSGIGNDGKFDPLCGLSDEFEKMGDATAMECLEIQCTIYYEHMSVIDWDRWSQFDKVLAQLAQSKWPKLKEVSLDIVLKSYFFQMDGDWNDDLIDALDALDETHFQWLSSTKSLEFDFFLEEHQGLY
ncbi:hypothetical protein BDN70DRAFT_871227 [Pholiota conissans]|uniref:Uncharacterized protein n=1 Tax=Pholiota conissans TaxID=109636 RepID=A0A9P6D6G3_9AGAR|nr:hypothetical protein BDN70DRAFT_871227 [Pholiota conissans]